MSSVAMVWHTTVTKELRKMQTWLGVVVVGGLIFLGCQYYEFAHFVHEGLKLNTNVFGSAFYILTVTASTLLLVVYGSALY